jgi:hypothetical protein
LDPFKEYKRIEEIMENASQLWFELEKLQKASYYMQDDLSDLK